MKDGGHSARRHSITDNGHPGGGQSPMWQHNFPGKLAAPNVPLAGELTGRIRPEAEIARLTRSRAVV
jgi:hypothetical protein